MYKAYEAEAGILAVDLLKQQRGESWTHTRQGEPRGYVDTQRLQELWVHTGTACNLACPFCLEGSKPGDKRLQPMSLADVQPLLEEALELGVEQFSFTGGEPFVIKGFVQILDFASRLRPCFVLTNGTEPLLRRKKQLLPLLNNPYPIKFRISLDYPDAERHDAGRGVGSFAQSLEGIRWLVENGFQVSIARQMEQGEDAAVVESAFRGLFVQAGIHQALPFTAFPDFGIPNSQGTGPEVTETCMTKYPTEESRAHFMCTYTRMLVKQKGRVRVYACTLVDDDLAYDLGASLGESLKTRVMFKHHRCLSCYKFGASCSAP
jgi:molybdenum cofactor biosynthesis enzyme MoaA